MFWAHRFWIHFWNRPEYPQVSVSERCSDLRIREPPRYAIIGSNTQFEAEADTLGRSLSHEHADAISDTDRIIFEPLNAHQPDYPECDLNDIYHLYANLEFIELCTPLLISFADTYLFRVWVPCWLVHRPLFLRAKFLRTRRCVKQRRTRARRYLRSLWKRWVCRGEYYSSGLSCRSIFRAWVYRWFRHSFTSSKLSSSPVLHTAMKNAI